MSRIATSRISLRGSLVRQLAIAAALGVVPTVSHAQATATPARFGAEDASIAERLGTRLDPQTRAAVLAVVDSARSRRVPTEPLVNKALEGASKRAASPRIVAVVRTLADDMARAREALGGSASDAEILAGAHALRAGVRPEMLRAIRDRRPQQGATVALGVVSELVASGVPADTAAATVASISAAGAADEELVAFQRDVERDISLGAPPTTAASARADGLTGPTEGFGRGSTKTTPRSPKRKP